MTVQRRVPRWVRGRLGLVVVALGAADARAQVEQQVCIGSVATRQFDTTLVALPAYPLARSPGMPAALGDVLAVVGREVNTCRGTRHELYVAHLKPPADADTVTTVLVRRLVQDRPQHRPDADWYLVTVALNPARVIRVLEFR